VAARRRVEEGRHQAGPRRRRRGRGERRGAPATSSVAEERRRRRRARLVAAAAQEAPDGDLPRLPVLHDGPVHQRYQAFHCNGPGDRPIDGLDNTLLVDELLASSREKFSEPHFRML